jgi:hypothetical protein
MPTEKLSPGEILKFRDEAFLRYHANPNFRERIETKFGKKAVESIEFMIKIKLTRKIYS